MKDDFNFFVKVLVVVGILFLVGLLADIRRVIIKGQIAERKGIEELHREFTRYITTGECGQFLDNKNQLREVVSK